MSVFDLPMTARPGKDTIAGQDELGRTVYRTVTGERYTMPERTEMPAPTMGQRFENLGGLASRAYENLSVQGAIDAAKGIGEGIVSGIVQGFTAPGRALYGEPVSLGDVLATSGMAQVGAAPLRAPAGSLRSGAMGGGRPPVTFDDVARAMDEGAPAPSPSFTLYQGSPHNFAAERLVRYPDGRTEYIVGAPDVLPDVPAGAEVLQDFPLGRQRMDKIGTGEGEQAYGYGLYGAEAEGVARGYRDALTDPDAVPLQFDGRPVNTPWNEEIRERWPEYFSNLSETDADAMEELLGNLSQVNNIADVQNVLGGVSSRAKVLYSRIVKPKLVKPDVGAGRMYELNINANPEDFINYDAPLRAQSQKVKDTFGYTPKPTPEDEIAAFEIAKRETPNDIGGHPAVQGIYNRQSASDAAERRFQRQVQGGGIDDAARISLSEAGIPGIRYFDAGSRGADAGTRNFVIFDENLISIVRKYGIAGAAAMLGVSAVEVEQALADNLPQDQWESLVVGK